MLCMVDYCCALFSHLKTCTTHTEYTHVKKCTTATGKLFFSPAEFFAPILWYVALENKHNCINIGILKVLSHKLYEIK